MLLLYLKLNVHNGTFVCFLNVKDGHFPFKSTHSALFLTQSLFHSLGHFNKISGAEKITTYNSVLIYNHTISQSFIGKIKSSNRPVMRRNWCPPLTFWKDNLFPMCAWKHPWGLGDHWLWFFILKSSIYWAKCRGPWARARLGDSYSYRMLTW